MKIKIHSAELNRMLKTAVKCTDNKMNPKNANINIIHRDDLLTIRATNGTVSAVMTAPMFGGDGESFYVDGDMFSRVCLKCSGEIEISTDDKACTVKGAGRTRIPIVNCEIPEFAEVHGTTVEITADDFARCYRCVKHAISSDVNRLILTGVHVDTDGRKLRIVALDGFQLAMESLLCYEDGINATVPGVFMELVSSNISAGEKIRFTFGDGRVQAETDGMTISCVLLIGNYVDYGKIIPEAFGTECIVKVAELRDALKSGSVVNNKNNLVKLRVDSTRMTVTSNSEEADFEAFIDCDTHGDGLMIAFNLKYLEATMNSIDAKYAVMRFNSPTSPCVVQGKDEDGTRLILPVRVMG